MAKREKVNGKDTAASIQSKPISRDILPIPDAKHIGLTTYDAKDGDVTLYYDGKTVGKGRVEKTQPMGYSADEACDVGADTGSPASPDYGPASNAFNGDIAWVQIDIGTDDHDHRSRRRSASALRWQGSNSKC